MTGRALRRLVGQNLRRGRRAFVLSVFGISVGISSLVFFLALSSGVRRVVLGKVFPAGQLEVVPSTSSLGGPLSRRQASFADKWRFVAAHLADALGFGTAVALAMAVPGLGLIVPPAAAVGATLLYVDLTR